MKIRVYGIVKTAIFALIASGMMVGADDSFAMNYNHQRAAMCNALVDSKGLKGDARKAEFQKCRADPINYK